MHTLYSYINLGQAYIIIILVSRFLFTTIIIAEVILLQHVPPKDKVVTLFLTNKIYNFKTITNYNNNVLYLQYTASKI